MEEGGEVVMETEHRTTDGGNRQGHVVIKVSCGPSYPHVGRIFCVISVIRVPSKPAIVFSPHKPFYSQPNYFLMCI